MVSTNSNFGNDSAKHDVGNTYGEQSSVNPINPNNSMNKDMKPRQTKKTILLAIVLFAVITFGVVIGVLLMTKKDYTVHFVTGPFAQTSDVNVASDRYFVLPEIDDVISDDGTMILAEFTKWFIDEDRSVEYVRGPVNEDLTLYAGYDLKDVTSTFYAKNEYDGNGGLIYLGNIKTKFYTGEINFDEIAQEISLLSCSGDEYESDELISKYVSVSSPELGKTGYTKEQYVRFLENYFEISSFALGDTTLQAGESISTPKGNTSFEVIMTKKNVTLTFHSNLNSVKTYYNGMSVEEQEYDDEASSVLTPYDTNYNFGTFATFGYDESNPLYHQFKGWSITDPEVDENGVVQNVNYSNSYFAYGQSQKLNRDFLGDKTELEFFAVWEEFLIPLRIYESNSDNNPFSVDVTAGTAKSIAEWASVDIVEYLENEKVGYALVGFNSKVDLTGTALNSSSEILADINVRSQPYYDSNTNSIVLYAVYKKIVEQTQIFVNDDLIDVATIPTDSNQLTALFQLDLNLGNDTYVYNDADSITYSYYTINKKIVITNLLVGSIINLPTFERENYSFDKYTFKNENYFAEIDFVIVDSSLTNENLQMEWLGTQCDLVINKYDGDDGEGVPITLTVPYGSNLTLTTSATVDRNLSTVICEIVNDATGQVVSNFQFVKEGYDFKGFFTQEVGGTSISSFCVNKNFSTMFAQWEIQNYSLTYVLGGGNFEDRDDGNNLGDIYTKIDLEYNSPLTLLGEDKIARTNYYFEGWALNENGEEAIYSYNDLNITIKNEMTLYAVWTEIDYVELFIDANKSQMQKVAVTRTGDYVLSGTEFDGFVFSNFNTSPNGDGQDYTASETAKTFGENVIKDEDGNLELYAMFFKVSFDKGDDEGTYNVSGENPADRYLAYGAQISVFASKFIFFFKLLQFCWLGFKWNNI